LFSRRQLSVALTGAVAAAALAPRALAAPLPNLSSPDVGGALKAVAYKATPDASGTGNESRKLQGMIEAAARDNSAVFMPPGTYNLSNLTLPDNTRLVGVAGATRIVYGGGGQLMTANGAKRIQLSELVIDGADRALGDNAGLLQFTGVGKVLIDNCEIVGSSKNGIRLDRSGGRIERSSISGAACSGIFATDSADLEITGNRVDNCGNGGILIFRWQKGEDGTVISGNRISRIAAKSGGTGQNGNGVNIYRADNVMITGNHISDCALTAIRTNAASDVQISDNQCLRCGETAIFCEFEFEGALVSGNLIDGAANGIAIANFDKGGRLASVTGNLIRNLSLTAPYPQNGGFGIGISAEADTLIASNVIENAPLWGLKLGWGTFLRNVIATGNIVRRASVGCAVSIVGGAGACVITNNLFESVPKGAIVGFRWDATGSQDLVGGSKAYPDLTIESNRLV
jgi:uncharacterized secreted repeat protein (TIGR03808 family)